MRANALPSCALKWRTRVYSSSDSSSELKSCALKWRTTVYSVAAARAHRQHPSYRLLLPQHAQRGWSTGSSTASVLQALASSTRTSVNVSVSVRVCVSGHTGTCFLNKHSCKRLCLAVLVYEALKLKLASGNVPESMPRVELLVYEALSGTSV